MKVKEVACDVIDQLLDNSDKFTTVEAVDRAMFKAGLSSKLDLLGTAELARMLGYHVVGHYVYA